jgi:hypothetical protein
MTSSTPPGIPPGSPGFYCNDCSRLAGEQPYGTTSRVGVWVLLEYNAEWRAKAVADNDLPPAVRAYLDAPLAGLKTRLQLIRHGGPRREEGLACFVAVADELAPRLYEFRLAAYEDLLALDLAAIAAGDERDAAHLRAEPLFLVCTNGRRDRACARDGLPVYQALQTVAGDSAWQTTHLGGHRFAATALFMPHGVGYAWVTPEEAPELVAAYRRGEIDPDRLRGRSCYTKEVQAAEVFLRQQTGERHLPGFQLVEAVPEDGGMLRVQFRALADGRVHVVRLAIDPAGLKVYTKSTATEPEAVTQYRLLDYRIL